MSWDKNIKNYYDNKKKTKTINEASGLQELIENLMEDMSDILNESWSKHLVLPEKQGQILQERPAQQTPESFSFTLESIPQLQTTELGWAAADRDTEGKAINPNRAELEAFLSKIAPGGTLAEKLASIRDVVENGFGEDASTTTVLSYLVFMKTLTFIIQNFNAASGGFTFESFLGVLLGGNQIPTGQDTIADLVSAEGEYISLKLLTEGKTAIDGSFTQLIKDLMPRGPAKGAMKYVIALKDFEGKGVDATGEVKVYDFVITRKTIAAIMSKNKHSQNSFRLLTPEARQAIYDPQPGQEYASTKMTKDTYLQGLVGDIQSGDGKLEQQIVKKARQVLNKELKGELARVRNEKTKERIKQKYKDANELLSTPDAMQHLGLDVPTAAMRLREEIQPNPTLFKVGDQVLTMMWDGQQGVERPDPKSNKGIKDKAKLPTEKEAERQRRIDLLGNDQLMSFEDSVAELNSMGGKYFQHLLKYSYGCVATQQFSLSQAAAKELISTAGIGSDLGSVSIGQQSIERAMQSARGSVNKKMFELFGEMSELSSALRGFFVNELDVGMGEKAIGSARKIEKGTKALAKKKSK